MQTTIWINHIGFLPHGAKRFAVKHPKAATFEIVDRRDRSVAYAGQLQPAGGDLEEALVGDFTALEAPGTYFIRCGDAVSDALVVHEGVYLAAMRAIYRYYPMQRCGDGDEGWHSPCHTAPARDVETGQLRDVTGGWHQSCDTRKWLSGTSTGMLGLYALSQCQALWPWARRQALDEMRWGNRYFHKMVRDDGGLMDFVSIPNDWDENGTRLLFSQDASFMTYYTVIAGQCMASRAFRGEDDGYADRCLTIARGLFAYADGDRMPGRYQPRAFKYHEYLPYIFRKSFRGSSCYYGDRLFALTWLDEAGGGYLDLAADCADRYCALLRGGDVRRDLAAACLWLDQSRGELSAAFQAGNLGPLGLARLLDRAPDHPSAPRWREAVRALATQAVLSAERNPFGLVPCYWYASGEGGGRPAGSAYYKYFFSDGAINIGLNHDILQKARFLIAAAPHTDCANACRAVAQRQVDWVLGCNPLGASTCEGLGRNHYQQLINTDEFLPPVPQLPGAVQTGIGCIDGTDSIQLGVDLVSCEYDMPATSSLLAALADLVSCEITGTAAAPR
ncbi:MAG: hypothetical protein GX558_05180 [Clostridiales bacterium]|nr:hypothetical protein [Clostridiales bacterium]